MGNVLMISVGKLGLQLSVLFSLHWKHHWMAWVVTFYINQLHLLFCGLDIQYFWYRLIQPFSQLSLPTEKPRERPKLNLLPRTVPREETAPTKPADGAPIEDKPDKPAAKPVSAEKVFGAAKPVDTAAK